MPWFAAKILLECRTDEAPDDPLCDEQIRLVEANDADAAYRQAVLLGTEEELAHGSAGCPISWKFHGLSDLVELRLTELASGTEVWSTLHIGTAAQSLVVERRELTAFAEEHRHGAPEEAPSGNVRRFAPR